MTESSQGDSPHVRLATRIVADIMNLDVLGQWPAGERNAWVLWSMEHNGARPDPIARCLGVTRERVRQIYQRELRRRDG